VHDNGKPIRRIHLQPVIEFFSGRFTKRSEGKGVYFIEKHPMLKYKRLREDMIEAFRIVRIFYHLEAAVKLNFNAFSTTRRIKYKLQKSLCHYNVRK